MWQNSSASRCKSRAPRGWLHLHGAAAGAAGARPPVHSDAPGTAAAAIPASSPALPSESADAAPPGAPTESDEETPLRALIADDNEINAVVLQRLLETLGCEVTAVADGLAATECFDEAAFDLIVLDLHMPVLDGLGAVRHIRDAETERGLSRHLVAALTADAMDETRARCLAAGFGVPHQTRAQGTAQRAWE